MDIGLIILSVFCAGGIFAYVREALRLSRLISSGTTAKAAIISKETIGGGNDEVAHYIVTYEFRDDRGETRTHEADLNSFKFFEGLNVGDRVDVLYQRGTENSYPLSQALKDLRLSRMIILGIAVVWVVMGAYLISIN